MVGEAFLPLPLPLDRNLLGATLFSQWLYLAPQANPLGVATSNGTAGTLELTLPTDGVAMIYSYAASSTTGIVRTHFFPVLRLVATPN
jgi:hypothetical protein